MTEIWKDVVGYEGIYEVSNRGRIRTHENKTTYTKRHGIRKWKQRYLKDKTPNGRDFRVALWKDGKVKYYLVHRLVAFAFIPLAEGKEYINHIDGNAKNNCVDNLEWCNHLENNRHAFENNLIKTEKPVILESEDGKILKEFKGMSAASRYLKRNNGYISGILKKGRHTVTNAEGRKFTVKASSHK